MEPKWTGSESEVKCEGSSCAGHLRPAIFSSAKKNLWNYHYFLFTNHELVKNIYYLKLKEAKEWRENICSGFQTKELNVVVTNFYVLNNKVQCLRVGNWFIFLCCIMYFSQIPVQWSRTIKNIPKFKVSCSPSSNTWAWLHMGSGGRGIEGVSCWLKLACWPVRSSKTKN